MDGFNMWHGIQYSCLFVQITACVLMSLGIGEPITNVIAVVGIVPVAAFGIIACN